jgi:hypothetical protein
MGIIKQPLASSVLPCVRDAAVMLKKIDRCEAVHYFFPLFRF